PDPARLAARPGRRALRSARGSRWRLARYPVQSCGDGRCREGEPASFGTETQQARAPGAALDLHGERGAGLQPVRALDADRAPQPALERGCDGNDSAAAQPAPLAVARDAGDLLAGLPASVAA